MIIQYIIVSLIIASAAGTVVFRLVKSVSHPSGKCDGCASSGCGGCAVQELKAKKAR
ncbi:MAG: FeoB-associated Cys-rich membrane protein [Bacteroidota bacterium]|jgi:FeoB-associated Cys-rich membrane protein